MNPHPREVIEDAPSLPQSLRPFPPPQHLHQVQYSEPSNAPPRREGSGKARPVSHYGYVNYSNAVAPTMQPHSIPQSSAPPTTESLRHQQQQLLFLQQHQLQQQQLQQQQLQLKQQQQQQQLPQSHIDQLLNPQWLTEVKQTVKQVKHYQQLQDLQQQKQQQQQLLLQQQTSQAQQQQQQQELLQHQYQLLQLQQQQQQQHLDKELQIQMQQQYILQLQKQIEQQQQQLQQQQLQEQQQQQQQQQQLHQLPVTNANAPAYRKPPEYGMMKENQLKQAMQQVVLRHPPNSNNAEVSHTVLLCSDERMFVTTLKKDFVGEQEMMDCN